MSKDIEAARAKYGATIEEHLIKARHRLTTAEATLTMVDMLVQTVDDQEFENKTEVALQFRLTLDLARMEARHGKEKVALLEDMKTQFEGAGK